MEITIGTKLITPSNIILSELEPYLYLIDKDGNFLVNNDGDYLVVNKETN